MKHLRLPLSIIFILLFSLTQLHAQERSFGIKGGAAAYQITSEFGDASSTSDRKIGFEAGIFGDFPISRIFSIQPEAVFVQKGGEESDDVFGTSSLTLNYVDVPLLLKINAPLDGAVKPYIFGGPYAGYLIEATADGDGGSEDISEFLEDINYGLKVGLGVKFGSVVIDARYDMGMANLYTEEEEMADFDFSVTTSGVVVSLGIAF